MSLIRGGVLEDPTPLCTLPTASATHDGCSQTVGVWLRLEQKKSPRESGILAIIINIIISINNIKLLLLKWDGGPRARQTTSPWCAPGSPTPEGNYYYYYYYDYYYYDDDYYYYY